MAFSVTPTNKLDKIILQGLTTISTSALHDLGYTVSGDDGKQYTYCQHVTSGVSTRAGHPCILSQSSTPYVVTGDTGDNDAAGAGGLGAYLGTFSSAGYVWIQTGGQVQEASVASTVAVGDEVFASDNNLFEAIEDSVTSVSALQYIPMGTVMTAAAGTTPSTATIMLKGNL